MNSNLIDLDERREREQERKQFHSVKWPEYERRRRERWADFAKTVGVGISLGALMLVLALMLVGCGGTNFATYPAAMSGVLAPYPLPYQYPAQEGYRSQYVVPQVSCRFQGNMEWCRPI